MNQPKYYNDNTAIQIVHTYTQENQKRNDYLAQLSVVVGSHSFRIHKAQRCLSAKRSTKLSKLMKLIHKKNNNLTTIM